MPSPLHAAYADHLPGKGKEVYANPADPGDGLVSVGGVIGTGTGYDGLPTEYTLPPAGDYIPLGMALSPSGMTRAEIFNVFEHAVGFSGGEDVSGWTLPGANSTSASLSCWVNFGVQTIVGWDPNPNQGALLELVAHPNEAPVPPSTLDQLWGSGGPSVPTEDNLRMVSWSYSGGGPAGPGIEDKYEDISGAYEFPLDGTMNAGWVHLMYAVRIDRTGPGGQVPGTCVYGLRVIIYANDEELVNTTLGGDEGPHAINNFPWAALDTFNIRNCIGGLDAKQAIPGEGLYGAVCEYWADDSFIDWGDAANRQKFHITPLASADNHSPCDLGERGQTPTGSAPVIYCSGGRTQFPNNRAKLIPNPINPGGPQMPEPLDVFGTLIDVSCPPD